LGGEPGLQRRRGMTNDVARNEVNLVNVEAGEPMDSRNVKGKEANVIVLGLKYVRLKNEVCGTHSQ
jgi:hypothetical protein